MYFAKAGLAKIALWVLFRISFDIFIYLFVRWNFKEEPLFSDFLHFFLIQKWRCSFNCSVSDIFLSVIFFAHLGEIILGIKKKHDEIPLQKPVWIKVSIHFPAIQRRPTLNPLKLWGVIEWNAVRHWWVFNHQNSVDLRPAHNLFWSFVNLEPPSQKLAGCSGEVSAS